MLNKKLIMVGCGASNLFAALYLIENGFNPKDITIIESGKDPITRKSLLRGFAGAGLFSDSKIVFSIHEDPLSEHISVDEKRHYHSVIQGIINKFFDVKDYMISNPVPDDKVKDFMSMAGVEYGGNTFLRQSVCWHLGTDNGVLMATNMYNYMLELGVNMLFGHMVTAIDLDSQVVTCKTSNGILNFHYNYMQMGMGKVGVNFIDDLIIRYDISVDSGYANVGGRFETKMNDRILEFSDDIQYDSKLVKTSHEGNFETRTFCVCHNSSYVVEEGIDGVVTYNGHSYGKHHEKQNGMTNFGVIVRIKNTDALKFHREILSKHGKGGCVIRGANWDGVSTIDRVAKEITWNEYADLYKDIELGSELTDTIKSFVEYNNKMFSMNNNYSLYIPEIKMAAGVIKTNSGYKLADGRYSNVSWVGDGTTGGVGLTPAYITGICGVKYLVNKFDDTPLTC